MPTPELVAQDHYRRRSHLVAGVAREARRLWRRVDRADIRGSWRPLAARLLVVLTGAQLVAAGSADDYAASVLSAQDAGADPAGSVDPRSLAGVASDGRNLATLLERPVFGALAAMAAGSDPGQALTAGSADLDMIVRTQVADAGRIADSIALTVRPQVAGYTRMVVGTTCARCIILAGRTYRWNSGFPRHPCCDCIHVPTTGGFDLVTDPRRVFDTMPAGQQDAAFGKAGAQAIRDGADMAKVVNARLGMQTASVFGRTTVITTEGTTVRGDFGRAQRGQLIQRPGQRVRSTAAIRLMPEQLYREAHGDRDEAIRLLRRFGYIR